MAYLGMRSVSVLFVVTVVCVAVLLFPSPASGQSSSASVRGLVRDPSGATIPGADVTLLQPDTNVQRKTVSNDAGVYSFSNVPPGHYSLTFTAKGFQTETIGTFDLTVNQTANIDAALKIGNVETSVTVNAQGTQIESSTAELGTLIGQKEVHDLPLNGRNFTQLLTLTPGATPISVGQNRTGSNTAVT